MPSALTLIRFTATLLVAAALASLVTACQKYHDQKRVNLLDETVRFYTSAIRWGDFEAAASAIRPREGDPLPVAYAYLKGVRVMSSDYRINATSEDAVEAEMVAVFTYQLEDSASVMTANQRALWWYDNDTQRWYLDGTKMPF